MVLRSAGSRAISSSCAAIGLVLAALLISACGAEDRSLTLVKPRLAIDQQLAEDFARLFDASAPVRIELIDNPNAELPGVEAVKAGLADLALTPNTAAYDPRVAAVAPLYPSVLHIAYRVDEGEAGTGMEDVIGDLTSRTVFAGPPGAPSRRLLEAAAGRDGILPGDINYIEAGCGEVMVVYTAVLPDVPAAIRQCGDYRLFSLGMPSDIGAGGALDSISLLNPTLKPFVIPADTYDELTPSPVVTLAVDNLLVARADLEEPVIYDLLSEVLRMKPALSASRPALFHHLTDQFDTSGLSFVMHPGALAYLKRDEPDLYERYSGVAEVVVTLMIGLISGIYGIWKLYSIRRKNRIDAFCREAFELRDQHLSGSLNQKALVEALKALQERAYDMLIHEQLAADESFRIFIGLTNDIMADSAGRERQSRS